MVVSTEQTQKFVIAFDKKKNHNRFKNLCIVNDQLGYLPNL